MTSIKPGWQTTEFWLTLVPQALALAVLVGLVAPADRETLQGAVINAVTAVGALATSATAIWKYIQARTELKTVASEENAAIVAK